MSYWAKNCLVGKLLVSVDISIFLRRIGFNFCECHKFSFVPFFAKVISTIP